MNLKDEIMCNMSQDRQTTNSPRLALLVGDGPIATTIAKSLTSNDYEVHITTPFSSALPSAKELSATKVHSCDLTSNSLQQLFTSIQPDIVISTSSGGSIETQKRIIDTAIKAGVKRFMPDEFGPDSLNAGVQQRLPPCAARAKVISHLQDRASKGEISWVGLAVGPILDRGLLSGNLGFDLQWQSATVHGDLRTEFVASSTAWIGRAVLGVLRRWDSVRDRYLYVAGLRTSAKEIADALQRATKQEWMVGETSVEECIESAIRRTQSGVDLDAGMFLLQRSLLYDESLAASKAFFERDDSELLGLQAERLEDVIHQVVHDHREHGGAAGCGCD